MRRGLERDVTRALGRQLSALEPGWIPAGPRLARRSGPWVQTIGIESSRWADEFIPLSGMTYLRSWDELPRVGPLLVGSRLKTAKHQVDDWISESRFRANPGTVIDSLRAQVLPRVDEPLRPEVAERLVREHVDDWRSHHVLVFIAAERLDRPEAEHHLRDLERLSRDLPVDNWVDSARVVVRLMDRQDELRQHLDAIEEGKLASIKGRSLG